MKAMILAAGLGTRLRPLTNDRPKALVEINGRTLLEITLARLRKFGVREVVINVHHFADVVANYLAANSNFGMQVEISREDERLLDTGGGLKNAAKFFLRDSADLPFFVHNVDVVSTIDLEEMLRLHRQHDALAVLAVRNRSSSRYLLFDEHSELVGRRVAKDSAPSNAELVRQANHPEALAFCGIHVISPRLLARMTETGVFSIIDAYLRLAGEGERILAFSADHYYWRDLGRPEHLVEAAADINHGNLVLPPLGDR
jgi:NDP-sugar pyrophosphorylase family protein